MDTDIDKSKKQKKAKWWVIIVLLLSILWFIVKPGIFTIQPIGAIPEGITIIYHSKNPEMSFFSGSALVRWRTAICIQALNQVNQSNFSILTIT